MQKNDRILIGVIFMLVLVIGLLVYDRQNEPETFGENVGEAIDRATEGIGNGADRSPRY
jgi:hypothetical protein